MKINPESLDLSDATLRALQSLTDRQQTCFILHFVYGYKYKEIATGLNISTVNARQITHRTKKQLSNCHKTPSSID